MASGHAFHIADYVVFSITIAISLGIGVYSALSGGRQKTTQEFLVGNREMKILPVTLSLIVSYESSILMLGMPGEMYTHGIQLWLNSISWCIAMVIIALLMVPTLYNLKIISAYEYLHGRFQSRAVRLIGSFLGGMTNLWYMGIVLYGPATALEAVTGFEVWYSVIVIAAVAIIYTTIGGIKAVIWADAFQTIIMVGGMLAIIIKGTMDVGGISKVYDISARGGRMNLFKLVDIRNCGVTLSFDFDPTVRITFWGVTLGGIFRSLANGTNQTSIQRISTMPTLKKAKLITILSGPGFILFGTLASMEGIVAYAYYRMKECDPLDQGIITNPNQIIPLFVMDLFATLPGLPGLFLAALFSASLSTLSSGYASISAIVWSDFIKPHVPTASEFKATLIAKILVVFAGVLSIGVAILVMQVGGPMTEISGTLLSAFSGPLAGLFLLGGCVPIANAKGGIVAVAVSSAFAIWKSLGTSFSPYTVRTPYLPAGPTTNCSVFNSSHHMSYLTGHTYTMEWTNTTTPSTTPTDSSWHPLLPFYAISYMWISPIAMLIVLIVGTVVSYATRKSTDEPVDSRYMFYFCDRVLCCLPERIRVIFRYNYEKKKEDTSMYVINKSFDTDVPPQEKRIALTSLLQTEKT